MTQQADGEHIGYVLFSQHMDNDRRVIIFVDEFEDVADAEEKKAAMNRDLPKEMGGVDVCVGLAHFHAHPSDEEKDFTLITPKDGSAPFYWHEMINIKDVMEVANG